MNLNVMKSHTEFWGCPMVLYCIICNIPLTKLSLLVNFYYNKMLFKKMLLMLIIEPLVYLQQYSPFDC